MAAVGKVLLDGLAQLGCDIVFDVVRDLIPHVLAIQNHDPPALPLNSPNRPLHANCGASIFCIIRRARSSLVFTTPSLTPSAAAVSAILNSWTSRMSSTSRYISGRLAVAFWSSSR